MTVLLGSALCCLAVLTVGRWVTPTVPDLLASAAVGAALGAVTDEVAILAVGAWSCAVALVDLNRHRLPNDLTLPAAAAVLVAAAHQGGGQVALLGGLALAAVHLVGSVVSSGSMGGGDVKLCLALGGLGATSGPSTWMVAAVLAPTTTLVLAAMTARTGGAAGIPHGPALCAATLVAWVNAGT
ncbi:prepilin peptidase [Rhodococcus sp. BP-349]|uniref:prepilin peptidase n=1 Tax=unclassified Rhodococcus (in: high G+C Gram-positive bacteria) TaxID=192944 RepID=UPI001C9ACED8|nr:MULTISPECIES: prepilin peptidase [unclassified Rhodococcus (in: high G+C Gram-positive bacteria)]MBY6541134.1 prepilin peptidase [Rhodococcus sp. BP-363]MBY6544840.1 prepilin peptidase [Rhodococcus sp. BP-369]MBY6564070.1 prepilin peptidase [Rhodococcus sp. BP-370]MBY6578993.1 prepilin peptidase [Rhodococcus sp. BP-364]MBY6588294.1 prepilin peptidase [Rhodococcus sp. BP-358]